MSASSLDNTYQMGKQDRNGICWGTAHSKAADHEAKNQHTVFLLASTSSTEGSTFGGRNATYKAPD